MTLKALLTAGALGALAVALPAHAAGPAKPASKPGAKPAPRQPAPKRPKPGTLSLRTLPGGWLVEIAGRAEHVHLGVPGWSARTGRSLLLSAATSDDYSELLASAITLVDGNGKLLRTESLAGNRPYDGDLSPDGTLAAVLGHPFVTTGEQAFLLVTDEAGRKWRKNADPEARVLAGNGWVALARPPAPAAAGHGDEEGASPPKAAPATFFNADGTPRKPPQPILGALARSETLVASFADGQLALHDAKLARRATASVPFKTGYPAVAPNGSLVAVSDLSGGDEKGLSGVALFDASAKPLGTFSMKAQVGVATAIAPDGAAVLAAPAVLPTGPVGAGPDELVLALFDRTGKPRWRYEARRRTPEEAFVSLSLAKGGTRAAAALVTGDEEMPGKVLVFDAQGKVIYEAEGVADAVWLDPSGEWLYTVEPGAFSRLKLSALRAGTAFPEDDDSDGADVEAEIEAEDEREYPADDGSESYPEEE